MNRIVRAIATALCAAALTYGTFTRADSRFIEELRSLTLETTDGVVLRLVSRKDELLLAVDREGNEATYRIDLHRPGAIVLGQVSVETDYRMEQGAAKKRLVVTVAIATELFDEHDRGIVDVYEVIVSDDLSLCSVLVQDESRSAAGTAACRPG